MRSLKEEGSGTILTAGVYAVVVLFVLVIDVYGVRTSTRARLGVIADLAALASAGVSVTAQWEDVSSRPCEKAGAVATRNSVTLDSCEILGAYARAIVSSSVKLMDVSVSVRVRAGAGPKE